jgi:hypothetical protein
MADQLQTTTDQETITRNVVSLAPRNLPATYIDGEVRGDYLIRAMKGEDVYGYGHRGDTEAWYIWDTDTRIPLPRLDQVKWTITGYSFVTDLTWSVTVRQESTGILSSFEIMLPTCTNESHAERLLTSLINNVNKWDTSPLDYNHCQFFGA